MAYALQQPNYDFYVSTNGNDAWSGNLSEPNSLRTDGPFATIGRAKERVKQLKQSNQFNKPVNIIVRGGAYYLSQPLVFEQQDSGTSNKPITYKAYVGEKPVISGGKVINNWVLDQLNGFNVWSVYIPDVKNNDLYFNQLFVNGQRRSRARTPNQGSYLYMDNIHNKYNTFTYKSKDAITWGKIEKNWAAQDDNINVVIYHWWETSRHYINSIDLGNYAINIAPDAPFTKLAPDSYILLYDMRYFIDNIRSGFDSVGEWYLDFKAGKLYYFPIPGETMAGTTIVIPVLRHIIDIEGNVESNQFVEYINFDGISFQHTDFEFNGLQSNGIAEQYKDATITAKGLRNSVIQNCEIAHIGEFGIWLREGSRNVTIKKCNIFDTGDGGIYLGDGQIRSNDDKSSSNNIIDNNFVHDIEKVSGTGEGIFVRESSGNNITHNHVCNTYYGGISVLAGWSTSNMCGPRNNIVEYNHIQNIGQGVLSDMGGIYASSGVCTSIGTYIRYNLIHDIDHYDYQSAFHHGYGANGIYSEWCGAGITYEKNIVYNTESASFFKNSCTGMKNSVHNNIFAFANKGGNGGVDNIGPIHRSWNQAGDNAPSFDFYNNIIYNIDKMPLGGDWINYKSGQKYEIDNNLYWITDEKIRQNINFSGKTFTAWQGMINDMHSIIADPLFYDAAKYDFRLRLESPAINKGFVPFNDEIARIGLYGEPEWVNLPFQYCGSPSKSGN